MFALRNKFAPQLARSFSTSSARYVAAGDKIPSVSLFEGSPGNEVNLAEEAASGKAIIIGVPGAFSPACSASHVPGYLTHLHEFHDKGYTSLFVTGVNDAFVMKAWGEATNKQAAAGVRFLADPKGEFAKKWDVLFDASKFFGNERSERYAVLVEDGTVTHAFVEPEKTAIDVSAAEAVLKHL
ncbi:hypothetical protein JCM33374_g4650 [Metschnikowia sp. JCM 33374]|nr:hypothetical protein JCM33374_g4650 [Metschnikowia sp. JCM 33374]